MGVNQAIHHQDHVYALWNIGYSILATLVAHAYLLKEKASKRSIVDIVVPKRERF